MPKKKDDPNQTKIGDNLKRTQNAFAVRHEPALAFDAMERRFLAAMEATDSVNAAESVFARDKAIQNRIDHMVVSGVADKLKKMVIASESAAEFYTGPEEVRRRALVESLFGTTLDGIRIETVDKLRKEKQATEEAMHAAVSAKEKAESNLAAANNRVDKAFDKIAEHLSQVERLKHDLKELSDDNTVLIGQCEQNDAEICARNAEVLDLKAEKERLQLATSSALDKAERRHELLSTIQVQKRELDLAKKETTKLRSEGDRLQKVVRDQAAAVKGRVEELKQSKIIIDGHVAKAEKLEEELSAAKMENVDLVDANSNLVSQLDEQKADAKKQMEEMDRELSDLRRDNSKLETTLEEQTTKAKDTKDKLDAEIKEIVSGHETAATKSAKEILKLRAIIDEQKVVVEKRDGDLQASILDASNLRTTVSELENVLDEQTTTAALQDDELQAANVEISLLQTALDEQTSRNKKLEEQLTTTRLHNNSLDDANKKLQSTLEAQIAIAKHKGDELATAESTNLLLQTAVDKHKATIQHQVEELHNMAAVHATMQADFAEQKSVAESMKKELAAATATVCWKSDAIKLQNEGVAAIRTTVSDITDAWRLESARQVNAIDRVRRDRNRWKKEVETTKSMYEREIGNARGALASLEIQHNETLRLRRQDGKAMAEMKQLAVNSQLAYDLQADSFGMKITRLEATITSLKSTNGELQTHNNGARDKISSQAAEINNREREILQLKQAVTRLQHANDSQGNDVTRLERASEATQREKDRLEGDVQQLQTRVTQGDEEISTMKETIEKLTKDHDLADAEHKKDTDMLKSKIKSLENKNEDLNMIIDAYDEGHQAKVEQGGEKDMKFYIDLSNDDDDDDEGSHQPQQFTFLISGKCLGGTTSKDGPQEIIAAMTDEWIPLWKMRFEERSGNNGEKDSGHRVWSRPTARIIASCVNRRANRMSSKLNGPHDHHINPSSACQRCINYKIPCVISSRDLALPVVLPLPEAMRVSLRPEHPEYWVRK